MSIELDELCEFICEHQGILPEKVTQDSRIVEDLGIAGEDGYELINDLMVQYDLDFSKFDFSIYFGSEGINPLDFFKLIFHRKNRKVLTVKLLYQICKSSSELR